MTTGDISLDGIIDGHVIVETYGDGDVSLKGKTVYGSGLVVSTDDGDINLWSECTVDECLLSTRNGNINASELFCLSTNIIVTESGSVTANVYKGSIEATINHGNLYLFAKNIFDDSSISVVKGDVHLSAPERSGFKLKVSAPCINVTPKLQNSGNLYLCQETGFETFSTEDSDSNRNELPVLTINVAQGSVNLAVAEDETTKSHSDYKYDEIAP